MHGLSGMQDDSQNHCRDKDAEETRCRSRRNLSEMRPGEARGQGRPLRRIHRLQQLSEVQVHQAENGWCRMSETRLRRRTHRTPLQTRKSFLRLPEAGLYTSPHLVRLNERIRIGEREISDEDLNDVFAAVKQAASTARDLLYPPTYFEMVTAMAFLYFRDRVKFAILEVGLGGRLDATNIVEQDVSIITSIGLDHQEFRGTTIDAIAAEKGGITKATDPVI